MILILSATDDPMSALVARALSDRGADFAFVSVHDMPGTVGLRLTADGKDDALVFGERDVLSLEHVKAIYHRIGFSNFEVYQEFDEAEVRFVNNQCQIAITPWLNTFPALVVNRPAASGSNASKPYQIALIAGHGFSVPKTLVTNMEGLVSEFYDANNCQVIYKSISYHRSVVQKMIEADFERLETLTYCPIQLQAYVPGFDVRVHVVSDRGVFACKIESEQSDYRYDKTSVLTPFELSDEVAQRCIEVTRALGLELSGIDLRITPEGETFCFEVNPTPAFGWYERRTGLPISECLVDYMIDRK